MFISTITAYTVLCGSGLLPGIVARQQKAEADQAAQLAARLIDHDDDEEDGMGGHSGGASGSVHKEEEEEEEENKRKALHASYLNATPHGTASYTTNSSNNDESLVSGRSSDSAKITKSKKVKTEKTKEQVMWGKKASSRCQQQSGDSTYG